jgi:hypothetical protein
VTTRDARHPLGADQDQARAACDRVLCATIPTAWWPSAQMRQVMGAGDFSFFDSDSPSAGAHRLQVVADEDAGVDIDAFLLVEACDDIRATC